MEYQNVEGLIKKLEIKVEDQSHNQVKSEINRMYPHGTNIKGNGKIMDFAHTWVGGSTHG